MAHADMAESVEHAFMRQNAVGECELLDKSVNLSARLPPAISAVRSADRAAGGGKARQNCYAVNSRTL